jgi:hypothetical protein
MMRGGLEAIEQQAAEFGFEKVRLPGTRTVRWRMRCGCGFEVLHGWQAKTSAELMVRNMRRQGWEVEHRRTPVCPKCRKLYGKDAFKAEEEDMSRHAAAAQLGPDPKIARRIYAKLEDVFNDQTRLYSSGWSDEKVGVELDVSPELVTRLRREAFGELAEDPAIGSLRDDITLTKMELDERVSGLKAEFEKKLTDLATRFDVILGSARRAAV